MKSPKGLVLSAIIVIAICIVAFKSNPKSNADGYKEKLLAVITDLLEKQHYSPKKIDDKFSKDVFHKFFDELDGDRTIFTQADINSLKKYETLIDDELHGSKIEFVPALNILYDKRYNELIAQQKEILSKPFNFSVNEEFIVDAEKLPFAKNETEKKERLRKRIKYMVLERYIDLMNEREKSTIDSVKNKTDIELEIEARKRVEKALEKMNNKIKTKFTPDERFNAFVNVITTQFDPHTDYFPPIEKRAFDEMMSGKFYGIGAQLQEVDGNIKVAMLMPNYPAFRSGEIVVGDIITKVAQGSLGEPIDITGYDISDAVKLIRGKKDSEVKLTVKKQDGTIKDVLLTRAEIVQDEAYVRSAVVTQDNGEKIGYISLPDFYADFNDKNGARCYVDVAKEILKLKRANIKGMVLDLRFNGGGSLQDVVNIVGFFIQKGPIVQVKDKDGNIYPLPDMDPSVLYDGPLVVMVNEMSASASEIFAAAIQDYGRGIVVGSTSTYGKGTVQRQYTLGGNSLMLGADNFNNATPDMGSVKMTMQKFYRINGGSTQLKGVTPDVVIPDVFDYLKIREKDNPLSMPWDEIAKANFNKSTQASDLQSVINKANNDIANNQIFKLIKQNTEWISKKNEEPINLEINKFKENRKNIANTVTQNNNVLKTKIEMNIDVTKEDYEKYYNNQDKAKGERYQTWLKNLKTDLYLNQTINIVKDLINSKEIVQAPAMTAQ